MQRGRVEEQGGNYLITKKHYMSKRTTTCNWLAVLELQWARCKKVRLPVNVMANSLTAVHKACTRRPSNCNKVHR